MAKKKDLPYLPFYPGDWFKALDVQALPRDIRLTWFEMLLRMWESKKRGFLTINGNVPTLEQIAQMLGFGEDVQKCEFHLTFLEKNSIFSRNKVGIIYNRKMVRDDALSLKRSKSGQKGMKSRYSKDEICYNKTDNKDVTNADIDIDIISSSFASKEGGVGETEKPNYFESHFNQVLPPEHLQTWYSYVNHQTAAGIKINRHNAMSHLKAFKDCYQNGISPPELLEAFQQSSHKGLYWISKNLIEEKEKQNGKQISENSQYGNGNKFNGSGNKKAVGEFDISGDTEYQYQTFKQEQHNGTS